MRKITIEIVPDQRLREIIWPLMEHIEEMEMIELLRLDLDRGLKIVVLKIKLAPGSTIDDISSTNLFDIKIVEVMEQKVRLTKIRLCEEGFTLSDGTTLRTLDKMLKQEREGQKKPRLRKPRASS